MPFDPFCIQKAYDQQTHMMQIGQNKHQVFQLFMAMGYIVPCFNHYFKTTSMKIKKGSINVDLNSKHVVNTENIKYYSKHGTYFLWYMHDNQYLFLFQIIW